MTLFLMHERNRAALEKLHSKDHDDEHDDIRQRLRQALADPSLSRRDRVRMACSLGAVLGGLLMAGDVFDNVPSAELGPGQGRGPRPPGRPQRLMAATWAASTGRLGPGSGQRVSTLGARHSMQSGSYATPAAVTGPLTAIFGLARVLAGVSALASASALTDAAGTAAASVTYPRVRRRAARAVPRHAHIPAD